MFHSAFSTLSIIDGFFFFFSLSLSLLLHFNFFTRRLFNKCDESFIIETRERIQ